jgi:hypothetical protein
MCNHHRVISSCDTQSIHPETAEGDEVSLALRVKKKLAELVLCEP